MKYIIIVLLPLFFLSSCDEPIRLDPNQSASRIIIEGQVTNKPGYQYVKVSRSGGFYETGKTPRITDAFVLVEDDLGNEYRFIHNPGNNADSAGYYRPENSFIGDIGRTYRLTVNIEEQIYQAEDKLYSVTAIDSLSYQINEDEKEDPEDEGKFYEVLLFAKEPQDTQDYYLFKFYRNDSLKVQEDTQIYFADDEILGESIDGVSSPIYFAPGDGARVEMYSISRTAFVFYTDLQNLLNSDGGLFSQPPSNSRTNLSNGALGFFQASALDISTVEIKE
ncbi:MAG TPA: DUF4249 domain-containing protein [Chryseolinea sp.]|nr:DUF4249 domain-containing protein [Chryseolinea sp.]